MTELITTLTAVTVYPDRARVTRRGKIALEAGSHTLEIAGLPLQLDPDSVRVNARGTAHARLLGVQVQRAYYTETPTGQVRELEAQVEALQDEMRGVDAQAEILAGSRSALAALAGHTETYATALAAGELTLEKQLALFAGLRQSLQELEREQAALALRRRELDRRLQKAKNELEALRSARPRERHTALVEVEVSQAGDLAVELVYVVAGASWKPLYDLRLLEEGQEPQMEVGYLAQVSQKTGEAWTDVALTLSTARPAAAGGLPELKPWYIAPPRPLPPPAPQPAMARASAPRMAKTAMAEEASFGLAAAEMALPAEMMAEEVTAQVEVTGAAVAYHVPGGTNIPPDGAAHKVVVARFPLPPRLDYVTAPRLAAAAYRRAKVTNHSPYTLLPGQANLFVGEEFVGSAPLELTAPGGEIEVALGVDDRLKVERELKRREVDKRLIGGKRRIMYAYEITLENLLPSPARITVHDQIPVARHEDIKIRLEAAEPKPATHSELNLLDWELVLEPKEKRSIRYDFSVEFPQAMEVVGLP